MGKHENYELVGKFYRFCKIPLGTWRLVIKDRGRAKANFLP